MASTTYTSVISFSDFLTRGSLFDVLQKEIDGLKKVSVYTDPYSAAYLIKWEIETPDYSFVKEDF